MIAAGEEITSRIRAKLLLAGLIVVVCAATLAAHWPVLSAQALSFDDQQYLTDNLLVQNPSWASARRFLTEVLEPSTVGGYYQPLAMISLMFDHALGGRGDDLAQFHRTSLALHAANTALVILLLYLLFGRPWVAAGVGLLFGLHPLTVEPVAWVGDRKTLLAAMFSLWCLILYVRYTRRRNWWLYAGCAVTYVLALMSKPTSTPLPALMLVMDYWPLGRVNRRAIIEKLPLFALAGIFAVITFVSQSSVGGALLPGDPGHGVWRVPLVLCHNVIFYLYKIVWPANLSSNYAFPKPLGLSDPMILAGVIGTCILVAILVISLRWTRALLAGWLFFFVAIFPTLGVVAFTVVIAADKFAYLPSVGLLMILAWLLGLPTAVGRRKARRATAAVIVLILAGAEALATRGYLVHWRDTVSLYEHMLSITPDAPRVHDGLGGALRLQGRFDEAITHFHRVLQARPFYAPAYNSLGAALQSQGKTDEAIGHFRRALQIEPDNAPAHNNLGKALASQGKLDEAINHFRQALPGNKSFAWLVHNNLAAALQSQGTVDEAIDHYRQALQIKRDCADAHYGLGSALASQGKLDEAISHYRQALRIKGDSAETHNDLANALQSQGKLPEAIVHYRQALEIRDDLAQAHYNLAKALTKTGRPREALEHFRRAARLNPRWPAPLNEMAWMLATHGDDGVRNGPEAVDFAERAAELTKHQDASILDTLAAAYASAGQFDRAIETAETAIKLAGANKLAEAVRKRLELYKQGKSFRPSSCKEASP